jgi:lipoprotein-anchoring transpeptidase ErfK/SrfK
VLIERWEGVMGPGAVPDSVGKSKMNQVASRMGMIALASCAVIGSFLPSSAQARDVVAFRDPGYSAGTIVIRTSERRLYFVLGDGRALRYPVGVGKYGKQWAGTTSISGKHWHPDWAPPAEVKHDIPSLPNLIRGGTAKNPMGVAAMTLAGTEYAIHGTNRPGSVGGFVSYGCIRMYNADITDLYSRVSVGATVVVTR